jgi:F420H(2)-dependent quinone reductase
LRLVLRSPLHGLLSRRTALITVTGRRSGREFTFPGGYEQCADSVHITVGAPEHKRWWRNLTDAGAPVRVQLRGVEQSGHAVASGDERSGVTVRRRSRSPGVSVRRTFRLIPRGWASDIATASA